MYPIQRCGDGHRDAGTGGFDVRAGRDGRVTPPTRDGYLPPTRTFSGDQLSVTAAGVRLQLVSTPGETLDAISVWLPEKRVLMTGDDFFRAFPNISPVRGAACTPIASA